MVHQRISALAAALLAISLSPAAYAVGGISGAKLATPNTATVPDKRMEFEPYLTVAYGDGGFDDGFVRTDTGSKDRSTEYGFRFTAGLSDSLELGIVTPHLFERSQQDDGAKLTGSGLGDIPLGLKWRTLTGESLSLALQGGITLPTGDSDPGPLQLPIGDGAFVPELGLISTLDAGEGFSFDVSLAGGAGLPVEDTDAGWIGAFDLAVGYYIGRVQPCIELNQAVGGSSSLESYLLSTNVGFTFDLSEEIIIVSGATIDLFGKNESRGYAGNLAFTFLL